MSLQNGARPVGTITIRLVPVGDTQYHVEVAHEHVEGGWQVVHEALLGALQVTLAQLFPDVQPGKAPVYQAMLGVLRAMLSGLMQTHQAPLIHRATDLPPGNWRGIPGE